MRLKGRTAAIMLAGLVAVQDAYAQDCVLTELVETLSPDASNADYFGNAVASTEGFFVVGAELEDPSGGNSGAAYVYNAANLTLDAKLIASDGAAGDQFGAAVDIDGDQIVVGAPGDDITGTDSGSAYVFRRLGTAWFQVAKLVPTNGTQASEFGRSVTISGDTVLVGGRARANVFDGTSGTWSEVASLTAPDANDTSFGVDVGAFGDSLVVGKNLDNDGAINSGAVYVFERSSGTIVFKQKLKALFPVQNAQFGGVCFSL